MEKLFWKRQREVAGLQHPTKWLVKTLKFERNDKNQKNLIGCLSNFLLVKFDTRSDSCLQDINTSIFEIIPYHLETIEAPCALIFM